MATPKTWVATDVTNNRPIGISQEGGFIHFTQFYQFKDGDGNILESLGERESSIKIEFTALPENIQNALITIRDHLYNIALTNEGMAE